MRSKEKLATSDQLSNEESDPKSSAIKDQILHKMQEQNNLLKERLHREEKNSSLLKERLAKEEKRSHKKSKANHKLKDQIRQLQIEKERKEQQQFTFRENQQVYKRETFVPQSAQSTTKYPQSAKSTSVPQ